MFGKKKKAEAAKAEQEASKKTDGRILLYSDIIDALYDEMAVAYGLGLRLNFNYFILRLDMGMKAINPAYEHGRDHYPIFHPRFSRDFTFHFAVGLPF